MAAENRAIFKNNFVIINETRTFLLKVWKFSPLSYWWDIYKILDTGKKFGKIGGVSVEI